jgi:hypothetical protein
MALHGLDPSTKRDPFEVQRDGFVCLPHRTIELAALHALGGLTGDPPRRTLENEHCLYYIYLIIMIK